MRLWNKKKRDLPPFTITLAGNMLNQGHPWKVGLSKKPISLKTYILPLESDNDLFLLWKDQVFGNKRPRRGMIHREPMHFPRLSLEDRRTDLLRVFDPSTNLSHGRLPGGCRAGVKKETRWE